MNDTMNCDNLSPNINKMKDKTNKKKGSNFPFSSQLIDFN